MTESQTFTIDLEETSGSDRPAPTIENGAPTIFDVSNASRAAVQAVLPSGSWSTAVVEIKQCLSRSSRAVSLVPSVTFTGEDVQEFDCRTATDLIAEVTTAEGSSLEVDLVFSKWSET